jgi:hypothetical protein
MISFICILLLLCVLLLFNEANASASFSPSSSSVVLCPAFFFVLTLDDYHRIWNRSIVEGGNYVLKNGSQLSSEFYYDAGEVEKHVDTYKCPMITVVITDHFERFEREIAEWIHYECKRLKKQLTECFRPRSLTLSIPPPPTAAPTPPPTPPAEILSGGKQQDQRSTPQIVPFDIHGTSTSPIPTTSPTPMNVPCESFTTHADCTSEENNTKSTCDWFGLVLGCREIHFCSFNTRDACLARKRWCKWRHQRGCYTRTSTVLNRV